MDKSKSLFLFLFSFCFSQIIVAQSGSLHAIEVAGSMMVQLENELLPLKNTTFEVSVVGKVTTDEQGKFSFDFPLKEERLFKGSDDIWIKMEEYEILRPFKGILQVDTLDFEITLDVLVIKKGAVSNYSKEVKKLNKRLEKLQLQNALSTARLNAINDSLLSNLQRNEAQKNKLRGQIADLEANLQSASSDNEALVKKLTTAKSDLEELQLSLETTNAQLEQALEEKYLRQQTFFKTITEDLQNFLIRTKDVHELFLDIGNYFPSSNAPGFIETYNNALVAYSKVIEKINEERDNNVQGVRQYWENPQIAKQVSRTYEVVFDLIHYPKLQPSVRALNNLIRNNKKKKAISAGKVAFEDLTAPIINLEKMINKVVADLDETQ